MLLQRRDNAYFNVAVENDKSAEDIPGTTNYSTFCLAYDNFLYSESDHKSHAHIVT